MMTVAALKAKLNNFILAVIDLAELHPGGERRSELLSIIEGTLRKNVMRTQAISLLCDQEKLSSSAMELTRNMVEDVVSIEYMLAAPDPEKEANRFYEFKWVQLKEDLAYYELVDTVPAQEDFLDTYDNINKRYAEAIKLYADFRDKDGVRLHTWKRSGVKGMMESLKRKNVLSDSEVSSLTRTYLIGSRKVHFNPVEVLVYLDQEAWDTSSEGDLKLALVVSSASLIRLVTRYIDLIRTIDGDNVHQDIGDRANTFLAELDQVSTLVLR